MTKRKTKGGLNSRKNREKAWALQAAIREAASRPLHTCCKETFEERMAREKEERARLRAEGLWAGALYPAPLGPQVEPVVAPPQRPSRLTVFSLFAMVALAAGVPERGR